MSPRLASTPEIVGAETDGKGGTAYRRLTFKRTNSAPSISGQDTDLGRALGLPCGRDEDFRGPLVGLLGGRKLELDDLLVLGEVPDPHTRREVAVHGLDAEPSRMRGMTGRSPSPALEVLLNERAKRN